MNKRDFKSIITQKGALLAPMAGFCDAPFRRICREFGASMVTSEMVSSRGLAFKDKNTEKLLYIFDNERPCSVQIFGNDPDTMARAAVLSYEKSNCDAVDINMGCPAPKIVSNGDGSALMRNLELSYNIISRVVLECPVPVTVKFRLGYSKNEINAVEFAKMVQDAGASALCVHGRTRDQMYSGTADWEQIKNIKDAVSIPVIGNGDITDTKSALWAMEYSGVDYIMVGRGALGNPWIFRQIACALNGLDVPPAPSPYEKIEVALRHFDMAVDFKGERVAVAEMRKHISCYLKGLAGGARLRFEVNSAKTANEVKKVLQEVLKGEGKV